VDGGSLRMTGATHEVVSAYESAMALGDSVGAGANIGMRQAETTGIEAKFVRWEVAEGGVGHKLSGTGPVTVKFTLKVTRPINEAIHGMALYTHEQQLVFAHPTQKVRLSPGEYEFCHTFPMLPLRPGPYSWLATLYDEEDGHVVDWWNCVPEMIVTTENYQSTYDEWNGILNLPTQFEMLTNASVGQGTGAADAHE